MIDLQELEKIIREVASFHGAFLVDHHVGSDNRITVHVGHKEGISLKMLGNISRGIEERLDRETEDFELEVSSPGVGSPLKVMEQYEANVGRALKVTTLSGEVLRGDFTDFDGEAVTLSWKERVPKEVGKGKKTVERTEKIPLIEIKEAKIEIRF